MNRFALSVSVVLAVTSICSGQWLERQVVLGDTFGGLGYPGKVAVNPISGNVYIEANTQDQVFNPATMEKLRGPGVSGEVVFCPPSGKGYVVRETLLTISAAADTVIGRTVLPFDPRVVAYNRTLNRLYLGSSNDSSLLVFDPDHDSLVKTIAMGPVWALAWDSVRNRLYIGTFTNSAPRCPLKVLDCNADTLLPDLELGFEYWYGLVLSPASHKLYCTGLDTTERDKLVVVSTDSLKPIGTVPGLPSVGIAAYSPLKDWLYVLDYKSIYVVDCRSDSIRASCDLGVSINATVVSSLTGRVYLGDDDSARVLVMDTTSTVVGRIRLPGSAKVWNDAMAFFPDRNQVYGATGWDGVAFAVDALSDTLAGWVSYQRHIPSQMVHNPAGNRLYLMGEGTDDILVFDSAFGTPKRIPCSMYAEQAVMNQTLNRLYVATGYDLQVIDCNTDSLIESKELHGLYHPLPVLVPYLNKVYLFSAEALDSVYVYDCLTDKLSSVLYLTTPVTGALYDPRSNRVFFSCGPAPTVRALDPVTDEVVKTFDLVSTPYHGRMAVNVDLGRLYYTDQLPTKLFTIDVLADSVIATDSLPWGVEGLFLDRHLGKLFMCGTDPARTLVYDCNQRAIVDTIDVGYDGAGMMDDRNDKLYLSHGAVVDCRYDSVVARLESVSMSCMAWDQIDNRVFQATDNSRLLVYRDDPYGVEEQQPMKVQPMLRVIGNPVRNALKLCLQIPRGQTGDLTLHDVTGRAVRTLSVARAGTLVLDLRSMSAGVYFVRLKTGVTEATAKVIVER